MLQKIAHNPPLATTNKARKVLVPFQLATGSHVLSLVIAVNLLATLVTLNRLFRFDGYQVYSDFFSIANLR